ncbi:MAG: hypothetical protein K2K11_03820 [Bacteroidales bacterium]|nr:hypothetical protein [Bacteroidales bacterium]MDE6630529.1 hypothetical protein [Bacteroidales bacterium]
MTQLTITIENPAALPGIKKFLGKIQGVTITSSTAVRKRKTGIDLALEDVRAGRVNTYKSSEELFQKLGI